MRPRDVEGRAMALRDGTKESRSQSMIEGSIVSTIVFYAFCAVVVQRLCGELTDILIYPVCDMVVALKA